MEALGIDLSVIAQQGFLGIATVILSVYIVSIEKKHAQERKELTDSMGKQTDRMIEAFDKNTSVLSEVKAIIQTISKS